MKRNKLINALLIPTLVSSLPLAITSCSNETNVAHEIYEDALLQFVNLCAIPHCSNEDGHMDSLVDIDNQVMNVAGLVIDQSKITKDELGNIWYDIPASKGCESYKKIILQSHLDMVGVSSDDKWNKWTDPVAHPVIEENEDGEKVMHAQDYKTNLGVDDGAGVALMLSLTLNKDLFKHGEIRCIYTVNEENGLPGAENIPNDAIDTNYLINLDGNPIGDVVFNSAGGFGPMWNVNNLQINNDNFSVVTMTISNCSGGHSGLNINDNLINPIKLLAKAITKNVSEKGKEFQLVSFVSGDDATKTAIQKEATVSFAVDGLDIQTLQNWLENEIKNYSEDWQSIQISITKEDKTSIDVVNATTSGMIIRMINDIEYGAHTYGGEPDEDPTSIKWSSNIGVINVDAKSRLFKIYAAVRFQEERWLQEPENIYNSLFSDYFYKFKKLGSAPDEWQVIEKGQPGCNVYYPWEGNKTGKLCKICNDAYTSIGIESKFKRIHGGLECSEFVNKNPNIQQVSIGPTNDAEHSVRENLYLKSYEQLTLALVKILTKMNF